MRPSSTASGTSGQQPGSGSGPNSTPVEYPTAGVTARRPPRPGAFASRQITMRSISSSVTVSAVRSYSFVVLGDAWPAICWACSSVPPFDRYAVIPVAPERVAAQSTPAGPRGRRPALDHRQHHAPRQRPTAQAARPVDALKQRRPSRPRSRRRPDTHRRRLRPGDGPARRDACPPSRVAAATPEVPCRK